MIERPSIKVQDLRKQYATTLAVNIRLLELRPGEIFGLLGPTGAGKSTLLRLLAAVEAPTTGLVSFCGQGSPLTALPLEQRRRITMVYQRPLLLRGTIRHNVEWALRRHGRLRTSSARVTETLERFGLASSADRPARSLSGGQAQLVALARALVLEPDVLLLDEPTAHLDPALVNLVEQVVQKDFQQRRPIVVWATHNLFQARRVAQRVGLLLDGQLVEEADTESFFQRPADERTKSFVEGKLIY